MLEKSYLLNIIGSQLPFTESKVSGSLEEPHQREIFFSDYTIAGGIDIQSFIIHTKDNGCNIKYIYTEVSGVGFEGRLLPNDQWRVCMTTMDQWGKVLTSDKNIYNQSEMISIFFDFLSKPETGISINKIKLIKREHNLNILEI